MNSTENKTYPPRLSVDELRSELGTYLEVRASEHLPGKVDGRQPATIDLDRRKVEYFLTWLEKRLAHQ